MKNLLIIFFLLFITNIINAQVSEQIEETEKPINLIFKYSPISLVNLIYPSIQFAVEHRISEKRAIQYEFGGFKTDTPWFVIGGNSTIYRGLVEYRWYKETPTFNKKNKFQGIGFRFQQRINDEREFIIIIDNYTNRLNLDHVHTSTGVYYTRGFQKIYNGKHSVEFGAALGVQYYDVAIRDIPNGVEENQLDSSNIFIFKPGSLVVPMAFLVLKVGLVAK